MLRPRMVCVRMEVLLTKSRRGLALGGELGQAEIQNFCLAAVDEKNIGGLDVAVNDAFGVRGFEAVGDLNADFEEFG